MRLLRLTAALIAGAGAAWALLLAISGGADVRMLGAVLTAHDPRRPLLIASLALVVFILAGGTIRKPDRALRACRHLAALIAGAVLGIRHRWIAIALTAATFGLGVAYSTTTAGGSDEYGYVSQADLWLKGDLRVEQPFVEQMPWPQKRWAFAPFGYKPYDDEGFAIVPTYSPGLPMLMAAAKFAGGQTGLFLVVPLLGALMVLATYGIGCRLGAPWTGVLAAWFAATSPAFLFMLMVPLSDVAVAGAWAGAFFFLLGRSIRSAAAAGVCAAIAILIRPNLFPAGAALGLWHLWRAWTPDRAARRAFLARAGVFAACALPGIVADLAINNWLYGSPTTSGYGSLSAQFEWKNVIPNLQRYLSWFSGSQTPVAFLGFAALAFPLRRLWPGVVDRRVLAVMAIFVAIVWSEYIAYLVFEAWWYLRFLLCTWPFLMLGMASVFIYMASRGRILAVITAAAAIGLGAFYVTVAQRRSTFEQWYGDRHYVSVARLVRSMTPPNSAVVSLINSGSLRYYGGRMTIRYDNIDADWLDRAVAWMTARGVHVYALLEDVEVDEMKARFKGQKLLDALDRPILVYRGPADIRLCDLSSPPPPDTRPQIYTETYEANRFRAVAPASKMTFELRQ